jgi:hypothetical protein
MLTRCVRVGAWWRQLDGELGGKRPKTVLELTIDPPLVVEIGRSSGMSFSLSKRGPRLKKCRHLMMLCPHTRLCSTGFLCRYHRGMWGCALTPFVRS